jgi:hypothetical protein
MSRSGFTCFLDFLCKVSYRNMKTITKGNLFGSTDAFSLVSSSFGADSLSFLFESHVTFSFVYDQC